MVVVMTRGLLRSICCICHTVASYTPAWGLCPVAVLNRFLMPLCITSCFLQVEFRMVEFINNILFARQHLAALSLAHPQKQPARQSATPSLVVPASSPSPRNGSCGSCSDRGDSSQPDSTGRAPAPCSAGPSCSSEGGERKGGGHPRLSAGAVGCCSGNGRNRMNCSTTFPGIGCAIGGEPSLCGLSSDMGLDGGLFRVFVFSHGTAMKCLLRGLLAMDPHLTRNICVDNTSVTVLRHTLRGGWHVVTMNDTTHLTIARGPKKR